MKEAAQLTAEAEQLLDEWQDQKDVLEQATQKLYRALTLDPAYAGAYVQVCRLQIMSGYDAGRAFAPMSADTARKAIMKAIALDPSNGYARVLSAHLFVQSGRLADAKLELLEAEKIGTDSPWLAINWAQVYERQANVELAARYYESVIKSGTTAKKALGLAYGALARIELLKRNWSKAEEYHAGQLKVEPANPWSRINYAAALAFSGRFEQALPHAREAVRVRDNDAARHMLAISLYGRWATRVASGADQAAADADFAEARSLMPDLKHVAVETSAHPSLKIIANALVRQRLVDQADVYRRPD